MHPEYVKHIWYQGLGIGDMRPKESLEQQMFFF